VQGGAAHWEGGGGMGGGGMGGGGMGGGGMGGGMSPSPLGGLVQNPYAGEGHYLGGGGMGGMGGGGYLGEGPMPYGGEAGYRHGGLLGGSGGLFTSEHMTQLRREQEGPTPTRRRETSRDEQRSAEIGRDWSCGPHADAPGPFLARRPLLSLLLRSPSAGPCRTGKHRWHMLEA
jgi:hypothetical protein